MSALAHVGVFCKIVENQSRTFKLHDP
jgi:hypothetical protein